jgi:hypothetical protein
MPTVNEFKYLYLAGAGLMGAGVLLLTVPEIIAAWFNRQKGDTISEIVWSANIPGFILIIAMFLWVGIGVGLCVHFIGRGRWGL